MDTYDAFRIEATHIPTGDRLRFHRGWLIEDGKFAGQLAWLPDDFRRLPVVAVPQCELLAPVEVE